jgi:hypothetical protein
MRRAIWLVASTAVAVAVAVALASSGVAASPSPSAITAELVPSRLDLCAAKDDARLQLALTNTTTEPLAGVSIEIWLRVFQSDPSGQRLAATAELAIEQAAVDVSKIAELEVKSGAGALDEHDVHTAHVVVKNRSPYPLDVTAAVKLPPIVAPPRSEGARDGAVPPLQAKVSPQGTVALPLPLQAIRRGKGTVVIEAALSWTDARCRRAAGLLASFEVETESRSVAELTKLLGVPTLLVLPGFLVLATSMLLWKLGIRVGRDKQFPLQKTDPEFWLVGILISLIAMLVAYPFKRDLLDTFTIEELVTLWLLCLFAGGLLHLVGVLVTNRVRARRARERTFVVGDPPIAVLRKLAKRGQPALLDPVMVTADGKRAPALRLEPPVPDQPPAPGRRTWIVGPIGVTVEAAGEALQEALLRARTEGDATRLADLLEEHEATLRPTWKAGGPRLEAEANLKDTEGKCCLVEEAGA